MRTEIKYRKLDNSVIITGAVPFSEVGRYFLQASVGWIPFQPIKKYQKNIPTKLFEYMAYGIPVVSSDLQSIKPFIVDGQTGFIVRADSPAAHANAIIELLQNPDKAIKMGIHGQEIVMKHYQWSMMETRLLHLYKDLLS
jgi:glycosyltransferase involved in cell wall biosynthesis